ncbi:MAG: hypothetical protein M3458_23670 [Acidobacteriota bacterium]|nr:hypothetical protein [Acidobacteriota bacterium]
MAEMNSEYFSDATEDQAIIIAKPTDIVESAWAVMSAIGFSPPTELSTSMFRPRVLSALRF